MWFGEVFDRDRWGEVVEAYKEVMTQEELLGAKRGYSDGGVKPRFGLSEERPRDFNRGETLGTWALRNNMDLSA